MMLRVFIVLSCLCLAVFSLPLHKLFKRNLHLPKRSSFIESVATSVVSSHAGMDELLNRNELRGALSQLLVAETTADYLVPIFFREFDQDGDHHLNRNELVDAFTMYNFNP